MTHETIKDKIYEIICNGNHTMQTIYERVKKYGISDDEITAAVVSLNTDNRIRKIEGFYYSNIMQRDSGDRICAAFALYAGRNLVTTSKDYWFKTYNEAVRFAEGMQIGANAFRKRPAVVVYVLTEDGSYQFSKSINCNPHMFIPKVL